MRKWIGLVALAAIARADAPPAKSSTVEVEWRLLTAAVLGGRNNGFAVTCGQASVSRFLLTVRDASGSQAVTSVACPRAEESGHLTVTLRGRAPFTISATAPERRSLRSEQVRNVRPGDVVTVRMYAEGCDEACR